MAEDNSDKERIGCAPSTVFVCHQGIERSRRAARFLRDEGCNAETFEGGMDRMRKLTVDQVRSLIPDGTDLILIYDHVRGKGNQPSEQQIAIETCEALLKKAGIHYRELDTTSLKLFLSNMGVQNIGWKFNNQLA